MRRLIWAALLIGCGSPDADGFRYTPGSWRVTEALHGRAFEGYGAAVAWGADGVPRVGAPWQGPGRVYRGDVEFLEGIDGDFLGASLATRGAELLVGAPGRSAVMTDEGTPVLEGAAEAWIGGTVVAHAGGFAALGQGVVVGEGGFDVGERVWSLAAPRLDGTTTTLVVGLAAGGVAWDGGRRDAEGALGRGLLACDVDADGDDDLVVADPLTGVVAVHRIDAIGDVSLDRPDASHALGPGAGRALACVRGGVLVGAPERHPAAVGWIERPLDTTDVRWIETNTNPSSIGHSLAVGHGRALAGDPENGWVWVLEPRRRR